jgi:hypothetical protein
MHACGGLMTALKDLIPIIPKFEILCSGKQTGAKSDKYTGYDPNPPTPIARPQIKGYQQEAQLT